ncbi:hypothetical protein COCNU_scaffold003431G000040 [Cocos nucifera]|nr:hypothetical protein [Cocos nucifera]
MKGNNSTNVNTSPPFAEHRPASFPLGYYFRCGDKDHKKESCHNPIKCFICNRFGHKARSCSTSSPTSYWQRDKLQSQQMRPSRSQPSRRLGSSSKAAMNPLLPSASPLVAGHKKRKAFIIISSGMEETEFYLERAAFVEASERPVKEDDVQNALMSKANFTWKTRRLAKHNVFFVACPSKDIVHHPMTGGELKVMASTSKLIIGINSKEVLLASSNSSKSCLKWEDLTSFNLDFFCEVIDDVPESIDVTVGPFVYNGTVRVNFVSEQVPPGASFSNEGSNSNGDDWKFWFGSGDGSPSPENRKRTSPEPARTIPTKQVFQRILLAWNTESLPTNPSQTTGQSKLLVIADGRCRDPGPSFGKRSACFRSKKLKSLGLVEDSLSTVDILYINSSTPAQIKKMGSKYGFNCGSQSDPIAKLKIMAILRCGKNVNQVAGAVTG